MKHARWLILAALLLVVFFVGDWAISPGAAPSWTGFGAYDEGVSGPRAKTLWDWLDLLIVPGVLAFGVWFLGASQKDSEQRVEKDRQHQGVLDLFMGQISTLILEHGLRARRPRSALRAIARSYALGAFRRLDTGRKGQALQFLLEARLIQENAVIPLPGANLRNAALDKAALVGAEIRGAYLCDASLRDANLSGTSLRGSDLSGADFTGAILRDCDLSYAILKHANMRNVDLRRANLDWANVEGADLRNAMLTRKQCERLVGVSHAKMPECTAA